ncbi:Protein CHROMATIN REMODELING 20 [Neolecta irregularis DAH-3]|uniref:Protein CHROMATIN REMODELING 20 n=1 Tax=Neolecta irregularis (strain DAH-3) TaxID=1198029 RepID=A0A1U7LWK2_NEOID|nr:Protein CHROMATIN REMODELING 20 [Neolecta irregularis DAH-3]|eukprot:OLL26998.1 Protein CHROMATIN REMODELING 20 [Neolecta irregularis DAH-3]
MDDDPWNWNCEIVAKWLQITFPWGQKRAKIFIDEYIDGQVLLIGDFSTLCENILKFGERVKLENEISQLRSKSTQYLEHAVFSCSPLPSVEQFNVKTYPTRHLTIPEISLVTLYDTSGEALQDDNNQPSLKIWTGGYLSPASINQDGTDRVEGNCSPIPTDRLAGHFQELDNDGLLRPVVHHQPVSFDNVNDKHLSMSLSTNFMTSSQIHDKNNKRHISKPKPNFFYESRAFPLDQVFFQDLKTDDQALTHNDMIRGLPTNLGCKLGVQKFMKSFLQSPLGTRIEYTCRGNRRVVISPYSRRYVKPPAPMFVKVFDQVEDQVNGTIFNVVPECLIILVFQTSIDRLNIPPEQLTSLQLIGSRIRVPDALPLIINKQMEYDDLLKWEDMDDDTEVDFDALDSAVDSITEREMKIEAAENEKKSGISRSVKKLSEEQVDEIITLERSSYEEKWKEKQLPKFLCKAHSLWMKTRSKNIRLFYQNAREVELVKLQKSFVRVVEEILSQEWSTSFEVKRICSSFHTLVDQILFAKWALEVIHNGEPARVKSKLKANNKTTSTEEGDENNLDDRDEDEDSDDFDLEGFIIEDEEDSDNDLIEDYQLPLVADEEQIQDIVSVEHITHMRSTESETTDDSLEVQSPPTVMAKNVAVHSVQNTYLLGKQDGKVVSGSKDIHKTEEDIIHGEPNSIPVQESDFSNDNDVKSTRSTKTPEGDVKRSIGSIHHSPKIRTTRRVLKEVKNDRQTETRQASSGVISISDDDDDVVELPIQYLPRSPLDKEVIVILDSDEDQDNQTSSAEDRLCGICKDTFLSTHPKRVQGLLGLLKQTGVQNAFSVLVNIARSRMEKRPRGGKAPLVDLDDETRKNYNFLLSLHTTFVLPPRCTNKEAFSANDIALIQDLLKFQLLYETIPKAATDLGLMEHLSQKKCKRKRNDKISNKYLREASSAECSARQMDISKNDRPRRKKHRKVAIDQAGQSARTELQRELEVMNAREKAQLGKANGGSCIINLGHKEGEGNIEVNPYISRNLKEHQVRFAPSKHTGKVFLSKRQRGCLLAHTMGLGKALLGDQALISGKTLQVIAFLYTLAEAIYVSNRALPTKLRRKFLILCPPALCQNWLEEFYQWTPEHLRDEVLGPIHNMYQCKCSLNGIPMGSNGRAAPYSEEQYAEIHRTLINPGPSLVVADEAHVLKNEKTKLRGFADMFDTRRRIALTGSPLSNSLKEYYYMIDWIDKNFLGNYKEFNANTIIPVVEGLFTDSTPAEILLSQKRLHQLGKIIESKVHRRDIKAISYDMPSKYEFIIKLALRPVQYDYLLAYSEYIDVHTKGSSLGLLARMNDLQLICSHPVCFMQALNRRDSRALEKHQRDREQLQNNQDGGCGPVTESPHCTEPGEFEDLGEKLRDLGIVSAPPSSDYEWARALQDHVSGMYSLSLVSILKACQKVKEKALVFSHSLETIDYIQNALRVEGITSVRLDGKTRMTLRQQQTRHFNSDDTTAYLISAKAGSAGLNIQGAARVVLFDLTFNPQFDEQAVGRAYRLGQMKPVCVYRLHTIGTFEERLFGKNIHKLGLSSRVVDKKNPKRNVDRETLRDCFRAPPEESPAVQFDLPPEAHRDTVLIEALSEFVPFLHQLNDISRISDHVRGIITTDTFESPDENLMTEQDRAEAEAEAEKQTEVLATLGYLEENEHPPLAEPSHNSE